MLQRPIETTPLIGMWLFDPVRTQEGGLQQPLPSGSKDQGEILARNLFLLEHFLQKQVPELCQNCVKTLSVLVVGVSFRAKSRCPKLL